MATGLKLMRAIRVFEFGGPEVLKFQSDVAVSTPKDHQVLIKVHARGVNPYALAADLTVYPLPEKLVFKQGAAISIPYFTAY
uniref:Uncharacterized protein n=1 Tax=Lynx canadensis TaxID=61383 RepID=A0A667H5L7_LYNCA